MLNGKSRLTIVSILVLASLTVTAGAAASPLGSDLWTQAKAFLGIEAARSTATAESPQRTPAPKLAKSELVASAYEPLTALVMPGVGGATFRSNVTTGNWNTAGSWTLVSGTDADGIPDADDDVYVQTGHSISLVQNESCFDLHINTGGSAKVALGSNTLSINGKIRAYTGALGTIPGTSTSTPSAAPITITANSTGKISFVGSSRNITSTGEWGAGNTGSTTTFALEIALTAGQTATMQTSIKASSWNIVSGTLDAQNTIAADNGTTGQGDVLIGANGKVTSNQSGSSSSVIQRSGANRSGNLLVSGTLQLTGASPNIAVSTIDFTGTGAGTVEYSRAGTQTLAVASNSGANPNTYGNLKLSGTSAKTLSQNTTVNGTLTMAGDATQTLARGAFSLTYGASSILEYAGTAAQTTKDPEYPNVSGPPNLKINNTSGVTLHASRTNSGNTNLAQGTLSTTSSFTYTIGSVTGTVTRGTGYVIGKLNKTWVAAGSKTFEIGTANGYSPVDVNVTTNNGTSNMTVSATQGAMPALTGSGQKLARYWTLASGGASMTANLTFNYLASDAG
ncbi:MAG TPA: hypothetical protein VGO43_03385, partial [Pyrinomonadaceae bacterium]|nr:hypothetical protein [Pyrinomonadaceae bacterium]